MRKSCVQYQWFPTAIFLMIILLTSTARAESFFHYTNSDTVSKWVTEHEEKTMFEVLLRGGYFMDDAMNDAYPFLYGFVYNIFTYSKTTTRIADKVAGVVKSINGRGESGLLAAVGEPLQRYQNFDVIDASLVTIAIPLGVTIVHEFGAGDNKSFVPYFGYGLGFFLGFERISGHVSKTGATTIMEVEWVDTCYRHSFAGHAVIGARWKLTDRYSLVSELRWTQGGKGRLKRARLTPEQIQAGLEEVFADFQHPDFNFTGLSFDIGVRW